MDYGPAAAGEPGVSSILGCFREVLEPTSRHFGCASIAQHDRSCVQPLVDAWTSAAAGGASEYYCACTSRRHAG